MTDEAPSLFVVVVPVPHGSSDIKLEILGQFELSGVQTAPLHLPYRELTPSDALGLLMGYIAAGAIAEAPESIADRAAKENRRVVG